MDIARILIILWIILPVLLIGLFKIVKKMLQESYPSTTKGKVIDLSSGFERLNDTDEATAAKIGYVYTINEIEYIGQELPKDRKFKYGEKITILYNPEQPQESTVWDPVSKEDAIALGGLWLSASLGFAIILIFLSILCVYGCVIIARSRNQESEINLIALKILPILFLLAFGVLALYGGIYYLSIRGFLDQNLLWMWWNHQSLNFMPY